MGSLWQDLTYGARKLAASPGFTTVALVALALGIGANTAIFSVVNAVLLQPLPYPDPDRVVIAWEQAPTMETSVSYPNFVDWRDRQTTFERIAGARRESLNMTGLGEPERVQGRMVSADFFRVFGVDLDRGRDFTAEDDRPGAEPVAILSHDFWKRRFGGDDSTVGSSVTLNGTVFTVVGVAGPTFRYGSGADVFVPLGLFADRYTQRGMHPGLYVVGRLAPGVTEARAREDLDSIQAALGEQYPDTNTGRRSHMESLYDNTVQDVRPSLYVLLAAVGFVLLIACANVANLMLARAATRTREIALRAALGASRWRIVRQLLLEGVMLSLAGGALGLLLASWGTGVLVAMIPDGVPRMENIGVDARVLGFTFALAAMTGVLFGLAPALASSRPDVNDVLKEGERGSTGPRHRLRAVLVVVEMALALVLLVGAGLMVRSMRGLEQARLGFDPVDVLTMRMAMTVTPEDTNRALATIDQIDRGLRAIPGATAAGITSGLPLVGASEDSFYLDPGRMRDKEPEIMAVSYATTPGYAEAMGLTVLSGRFLTDADRADTAPVAVVDESFVALHCGGKDPIGKPLYNDPGDPPATIVGVVGHVKQYGVDGTAPVEAQVYTPLSQLAGRGLAFVTRDLTLVVRSEVAPSAVEAAARSAIRGADPAQPIFAVRAMDSVVASSLAARRFSTYLLTLFGALALLLAGVGIYGVMAYQTAQRTHEVGIRMALGARQADVLWMVLRQGVTLASVGLGLGVLAAFGLTRAMASLLYGVSATDPATFVGVAGILVAVALLACAVPASRASRVDPMRALRHD